MRLTIFGGTGPTGRLLVTAALDAGHDVTVFARSPGKLGIADERLRIVQGELSDAAGIRASIDGADAVISTLGPGAARVPGPRSPMACGTWSRRCRSSGSAGSS